MSENDKPSSRLFSMFRPSPSKKEVDRPAPDRVAPIPREESLADLVNNLRNSINLDRKHRKDISSSRRKT